MKNGARLFKKIYFYLNLSLQRHREGHLSIWRQILEILGVALVTGNGPGYYHAAGMFRRSIPWRDKYQHLGPRQYENRLRKLNPDPYQMISQNKLSEKGILQLLGIPTPRFIGHLHPTFGKTHKGSPLCTAKDLVSLLEEEQLTRICFKLVEGCEGSGFEAVDIFKNNGTHHFHRLSNAMTVTAEQFYEEMISLDPSNGVLIEDFFVQHPTLSALNPGSVNTCRVWVLDPEKGKPLTVLAYQRMGRAGSLVDNTSKGGLVAPIDVTTGELRTAIDGLPTRYEYSFHPDHGAPIEGLKLPFWKEAKALAESCLASFPWLGFAGLDIAISPTGPVVVEMNVQPNREGSSRVDFPSGRILPA